MDVYVIPVKGDRYELYFEGPPDVVTADAGDDEPSRGVFGWVTRKLPIVGRWRARFGEMLQAAEERRHRPAAAEPDGWGARLQNRIMTWVAERIAEQRLLWHLRGETAVTLAHPPDLTFDEVLLIVRRMLQRDYDRHLRWLVVDGVLLIVSGALALVPGPNLVAYYFIFRVVGHWLSMRGARQGLSRVSFSGRPGPPLVELRDVPALDPDVRRQRVHDISARLRLQYLPTFYSRIAA
jgi:hypothetical protein